MLGRIIENDEDITIAADIEIDIEQFNDVAVPHCICRQVTECKIGCQCECSVYCESYKDTYVSIINAGMTKYAFLTFNPAPISQTKCELSYAKRDKADYQDFKDFVKSFFRKNQYVEKYIAISELTKKGQVHYHVFFSFKSKVSIIKSIVQVLYHRGNVLMLYGTKPKMGIHYLFKSQEEMREYYQLDEGDNTSHIFIKN